MIDIAKQHDGTGDDGWYQVNEWYWAVTNEHKHKEHKVYLRVIKMYSYLCCNCIDIVIPCVTNAKRMDWRRVKHLI